MAEIKSEIKGNILYLFPTGRIDSASAAQDEAAITAAGNNFSGNVVLDAENLEYISSAGLRIMLRIRKEYPEFKVINASSEVYDIFDMTGFTEMMTVEKAYRKMNVDGCDIIGKGAKGTVYRYNGDTIIKVYNNPDSLPDIIRERELARKAFVLGIPTAISYDVVTVGEKYGSVFELLDAKSLSKMIASDPENTEKYVGMFADLLNIIHSTTVSAEDMPDIKKDINYKLENACRFLSDASAQKLRKLVAETPDRLTMIHGDYHTNNVMLQNGEAILIDMDTLSHGHPIFELLNVYVTYVGFSEVDPQNVENFLDISAEKARKIWDIFLPLYLKTDDRAILDAVCDKVKIVSYIRLIHFYNRHHGETEFGKNAVKYFSEKMEKMLPRVDTLDF